MKFENFILGLILVVLFLAIVLFALPRAVDKEFQFQDERTAQHLEETREEIK